MRGGPFRARPGRAVAVGGDVHQRRVTRRQFVVADAQLLRHAYAVVVDPDVRLRGQRLGDLLAGGGLEIEADALLAGIALGRAEAVEHAAEGIAGEGFDLDHPGAQVRQHRSAEGRGDDGGALHHRDAGQRLARRFALPRRTLHGVRFDSLEGCLHRLAAGIAGGSGQIRHQPQLLAAAVDDDVAVGRHVRVFEGGLGGLVGVRDDAAVRHEQARPLGQRLGLHMGEQAIPKALQHVLGPAHRIAFVLGIAQFVRQPRGAKEVGQQVRQQIPQLQPVAVLGAHRVVVQRRHGLGAVPRRRGPFEDAFVPQLGHRHDAHLVGHHAPQQRRIEAETVAAGLAPDQPGEQRRGGALSRSVGAHLQRGVVRAVAIRNASEGRHAAGLGGNHRLVARVAGVGAVLAEAGNHAEHEILAPQRRRVQLDARPLLPVQRRQHRIGRVRDQGPYLGHIGRRTQIRPHDALAAAPQRPRGHASERIPPLRHDLDDVRAEVRQQHRGQSGGRPDP